MPREQPALNLEDAACTTWRYSESGQTDLVLVNVRFNQGEEQPECDYRQVVALTFEEALKDKAFPSGSWFLEQLIYFMSSNHGEAPVFVFSDQLGLKIAGSTLRKFILSLMPKWLSSSAQAALHLRVRDVALVSAMIKIPIPGPDKGG